MNLVKGTVSALFAGMLLLAAPALRADAADKDAHKGGHWDKFGHLKKALDLSDDQVSKWKDAEKGQREESKLLKDKVKADFAALAVLVDEKASDDKISEAISGLEADHRAVDEQEKKQREAIKAILTPTQQAKAALMFFGPGHGRGHGRGGWGGGHPGMKDGPGPDGGPDKE